MIFISPICLATVPGQGFKDGQDYAEYLLQEKNAQAVSAKYTLEFTGEEWTYGELFK